MTRPAQDQIYGRTLAVAREPRRPRTTPVVLVHGVPDTAEVWEPLRAELEGREVVTLSLPGFGTDAPAGFGATRWDYRDWLIAELEALGRPVDAIGHDQGSLILQAVVRERPDLLRSWTLGGGVSDAGYQWHPQARVWQTARLGEASVETWLSLEHPERVRTLVASGMPVLPADRAARRLDRRMTDSILRLYRSEAFLGDWEFTADAPYPPGLVLWGERDPFQAVEFGRRAALASGAELVTFDCGHWWQLERPADVAATLRRFWEGLGESSGGVLSRLRMAG